ncbi:MAG: hypothetical protein KBG20_19670 [Caldilineaceae bacterium]|nr:hypothetical protein [Caldilineaceae bacterium]MBP8109526.1 hypothetical protein [Caldilineaceae bacterium]MBP8124754.1 hypothetical protein [Caldilineaceae bacterium]MBP9074537.1 hypothetical protein [Caldilineaceae bacterium]
MGNTERATLESRLSFLIQAVGWQDDLLQSYRILHLTFQSILLAIGIGLAVAVITATQAIPGTILLAVLSLLLFFQVMTSRGFEQIIKHRGKDVNFWHKEVIWAERVLPPDLRYFTQFKVFQKLHRSDLSYLRQKFLSPTEIETIAQEDIDLLIEKGMGHTRHVVDVRLFRGITVVWILITFASGIAFAIHQFEVIL